MLINRDQVQSPLPSQIMLTPGTSKRANLADSSRDTIELSANSGRAGFCGEHTKTVTRAYQNSGSENIAATTSEDSRTEFAEAQEYAVNNLRKRSHISYARLYGITYSEGGDMLRQLLVETAHDEPNDGLREQTKDLGNISSGPAERQDIAMVDVPSCTWARVGRQQRLR